MAVATVDDVAAWMGWDPADPVLTPVPRWLDALENMIRTRVPDFDERLTDDAYRARVLDIECIAVERKLRNPDGYASESVDNVALSYKSNAASGVLELTADEWADLGYRYGLGSIRVNPGQPPFPTEWDEWRRWWPPVGAEAWRY